MKPGDTLTATIKKISFHKEERMIQSNSHGIYSSNYVANFKEYPNGIAVVDTLAASMHPDWDNKTENRATILTKELAGNIVSVRVVDVYAGKETFEGVIV